MLSDINFPFSIISLSETWLHISESSYSFDLPGYQFISQPSSKRAGGVGFFIKNDIYFHIRDDLNSCTPEKEILWIEIENQLNKNILCGIVYRHPNSNLENFLNQLYSDIEQISRENKYCLLSGDFNINLLNFETHCLTEEFINTMSSNFFEPHILKPTRITDHSATLIDNIFFNSIDFPTISGNFIHDLTDHLLFFLIINQFDYNSSRKQKIYKRDYSNFDESFFLNEFKSIDWQDTFYGSSNVNDLFDTFYSKLSDITDRHAVIQEGGKISFKTLDNVWSENFYKNKE
jgi:hypothetical protein